MEQLVDTKKVAELTGMSKAWLERARWLGPGYGPPYLKIVRSVRYRPSEVEAWLEEYRIGKLN